MNQDLILVKKKNIRQTSSSKTSDKRKPNKSTTPGKRTFSQSGDNKSIFELQTNKKQSILENNTRTK